MGGCSEGVIISTHALREEGDLDKHHLSGAQPRFLPTPSARRATALTSLVNSPARFLPTPSARRATSIDHDILKAKLRFLPTPSARRATSGRSLRGERG